MTALGFYRKHFLPIEALACLAGWGSLLAYRLHTGHHLLDLNLPQEGIPELTVTVASSMLGFVLAGVTLLAAFQQQIRYLRQRDQYDQVVRLFFQAILFTGLTVVAGALAIVADGGIASVMRWALGLATLLAVARVCRVVWILYHLARAA